jgi:hypothetical protein
MNIIIISLILITMAIHKYLAVIYNSNNLPYPFAFSLYTNLQYLFWSINFIYIFGWVIGIIMTILSIYNVIYMTFLWPSIMPWVLRVQKDVNAFNVKIYYYTSWSFLVILLGILTLINFFVSKFQIFAPILLEFLKEYHILIILFVLISNGIRYVFLKKYT